MPLFEYSCKDCGQQFEAFVTASRSAACPKCKSANLAKLLSSPGMVGVGAPRATSQPPGGCGAGGAGCACKTN